MRVAFDLHGVIEKYPNEMRTLIDLLEWMGVETWLISGPPIAQIEQELNDLGFDDRGNAVFYGIASIVDFLKSDPMVKMWQDEHGNWWTDDESWWSSKAKICEMNAIHVIIDDSIQYSQYFGNGHKTKFILLKELNMEELRSNILKNLFDQGEMIDG